MRCLHYVRGAATAMAPRTWGIDVLRFAIFEPRGSASRIRRFGPRKTALLTPHSGGCKGLIIRNQNLPHLFHTGHVVLGSPVGSNEYVTAFAERAIDEARRILRLISSLLLDRDSRH